MSSCKTVDLRSSIPPITSVVLSIETLAFPMVTDRWGGFGKVFDGIVSLFALKVDRGRKLCIVCHENEILMILWFFGF